MQIADLKTLIREIAEVNDPTAKEVIPEVIVISSIPEKPIKGMDLIETVADLSNTLKDSIPEFDYTLWGEETIIETVDYLILCGVINGPTVNSGDDSHELLEGKISRNKTTEQYERELTHELFEYTYLTEPDNL